MHTGNYNIFSICNVFQSLQDGEGNFRFLLSVQANFLREQADFTGQKSNVFRFLRNRYFDVTWNRRLKLQRQVPGHKHISGSHIMQFFQVFYVITVSTRGRLKFFQFMTVFGTRQFQNFLSILNK